MRNAVIQNEMRNLARELLESGEATIVIGWEKAHCHIKVLR